MRFLADASCDFAVVRALRAQGHDVRSVLEERPAEADEAVAAWALRDDRIVLAEDKDFGYLVHVADVPSAGVVFLRSLRRCVPSWSGRSARLSRSSATGCAARSR